MANDMDFIGFTYNGKHSFDYFGIYRTSDGNRYNDNLIPPLNDKTADVPGGNGQYFFYTNNKPRQFSIPIAFDNLSETKYREMRTWLDGKAIHDLVFDEYPYKVYSAKVTGTPQLKTVCFEENGQRLYKGEGAIQFTCYHPFAHTPHFEETVREDNWIATEEVPCGIVLEIGDFVKSVTMHGMSVKYIEEGETEIKDITISPNDSLEASKRTYIISTQTLNGTGVRTIRINDTSVNTYYCTTQKCYEPQSTKRDGKNINHYTLADFPNKQEWCFASGISTPVDGDNYGDVPAPFIVTKMNVSANQIFKVADCEITVKEACSNFKWDSKTGLVTGKVGSETKERPIQYTGTSYGTIPVGGTTNIELNGATLDYDYWYY